MGEQAEKSWKQKFKFLTLEDVFLPKIRISNTTKKCNFPKLAQDKVWFFLLPSTTMYQCVLSCKKNSKNPTNKKLNAIVLIVKFSKTRAKSLNFASSFWAIYTVHRCLKPSKMDSQRNSDDFPFFYFSNPTSGSKVSLIPDFHSKIVIIIMNWTSIWPR